MKYYIIVASKDHVEAGVEKGFAQAGHGKRTSLDKLKKDDWVIYYSSKDKYEQGKAYQKFTTVGQVMDDEAYQVQVNDDFQPWRRNVQFYAVNELEIRPLLEKLSFIKNKDKWGMYLRFGFVEINETDFKRIAEPMLIYKKL